LQFAQVPRLLVQDQRAVTDAADFFHKVADFLEHLAQFAVAAFDENHFVPGIIALANLANASWGGADRGRTGLAPLNGDAGAQNVQLGLGGLAGNLDQVGFFHAGGGFGEAVG
jgi:hypothetical protein